MFFMFMSTIWQSSFLYVAHCCELFSIEEFCETVYYCDLYCMNNLFSLCSWGSGSTRAQCWLESSVWWCHATVCLETTSRWPASLSRAVTRAASTSALLHTSERTHTHTHTRKPAFLSWCVTLLQWRQSHLFLWQPASVEIVKDDTLQSSAALKICSLTHTHTHTHTHFKMQQRAPVFVDIHKHSTWIIMHRRTHTRAQLNTHSMNNQAHTYMPTHTYAQLYAYKHTHTHTFTCLNGYTL